MIVFFLFSGISSASVPENDEDVRRRHFSSLDREGAEGWSSPPQDEFRAQRSWGRETRRRASGQNPLSGEFSVDNVLDWRRGPARYTFHIILLTLYYPNLPKMLLSPWFLNLSSNQPKAAKLVEPLTFD